MPYVKLGKCSNFVQVSINKEADVTILVVRLPLVILVCFSLDMLPCLSRCQHIVQGVSRSLLRAPDCMGEYMFISVES